MILICDYCNKEYKTYKKPSCKKHYCSRLCSYKGRDTRIKINCQWCNKEINKRKNSIKENNFCSTKCVNLWQKRNKVKLICKTCHETFYRSASNVMPYKNCYCTIDCRNKDDEWKKNSVYKANLIQYKKKGLNKLELKGNSILDRLNIKYETQYLINNKICVDVFIPSKNIIIQWDGNYWHGKNKKYEELEPRIKQRVRLDKTQNNYFQKIGYTVLRFWEDEVMKNDQYVYDKIKNYLDIF